METGPKWYITRGEQRIGPLDASQLKHMAMTEQLGPTEYVWKEGMAQWVQAQQVQGLFDPPPPEPDAPDDASQAVTSADVSPVIPAYTPPAQPEVKPLIDLSSTTTKPAQPTATTPAAASPTHSPAKPAEQVKPSSSTAAPATKPAAATPATPATPAATSSARPAVAPAARAAIASHRSPLPAISTAFDGVLPVLAGILILATIGIPWFAAPEYRYGPVKVQFSWDMLNNTFSAGGQTSMGVWIIGAWVAGLAAIIITPLAKGTARAAIYTALGVFAAMLFIIVYFKIDTTSAFKSGLSELEKPLGVIASILTFAVIIITHLIRRSGPNTPLKISQLIAAGALAIITIILLITAFAASNSIWSQYGNWKVKSSYTGALRAALLVNFIGTALAAALLFISAILGGRRGILSGVGLALLYVIVLLSIAADIILPCGAFNDWTGLYAGICAAMIMLGTLIILGAGLVLLIDHLRRAGAPVIATGVRSAPPAAHPGETVEQKFAKLDQLRKTGVISDAEYQQKRAELLKQL